MRFERPSKALSNGHCRSNKGENNVHQDPQRLLHRRGTAATNSEAGSVSVEFALGLVGVVTVFAMILSGLDAAHARGQACQLARDSARQVALLAQHEAVGTTASPGSLDGGSVGGDVGSVAIQRDGQWVRVHAQWPLHSPVSWWAPHMSCDIHTYAEITDP